MQRPLLAVTVCFILGILGHSLWTWEPGFLFLIALTVFLLALAGHALARREAGLFVLLLFILLGWLSAAVEAQDSGGGPERFAGHYVHLEGTVDAEPRIDEAGNTTYILAVRAVYLGDRRVAASGLVQVKVRGGGPVYGYGQGIRAGGFLYLPPEPGNFGAFNYRDYLQRRGIRCLMTVNGAEHIRVLDGGHGNPLVAAALACKYRLMQVAGSTLDQRQAAVLSGMMFGSRERIDRATSDMFASTGVAHVLCVSGLHVGFVLAAALLVAGALGVPNRAYLAVAAPVLLFYAVMTGLGPAVLRSSLMALVVLLALLLNREKDWPSTLALAAGALLLYKPLLIYEIGFQLSFAATWGILYLGPPVGELLTGHFKLPRWLALPLQVTLAAQLATLPLLVYHFNLFTPVAPLANLVLVPLVGAVMLTGFTGCVSGLLFMPLAEFINIGTGLLIDLFLGLAGWLDSIPGGSAYVATPPLPVIPLWFAGLVLAVEGRRGRIKFTGWAGIGRAAPLAAGVMLMLVIFLPWGGTGGRLQVHFLDVGQGDSILVRFPGGGNMLVDTGGRPGEPEEMRLVGDSVVVPYLQRLGINKLDALVLTHPHDDHAGGAAAVLDKMRVGVLVISHAPGYEAVIRQAAMARVPVFRVGAGQVLQLDRRVEIRVLGPDRREAARAGEDLNDVSLVLRLEHGAVSVLLAGDIEERAQRQLLARGAELHCNVFKVPHHGSRFYTPRFYEAADPEFAVIQVGANNRFGHPAASVLETLERTGARVLRTDRDGAIMFVSDGRSLRLRTVKTTARAAGQ